MLFSDQFNQNNLLLPSFKTFIESLCGSIRNEGIRGQRSFGSMFEQHGLRIAHPSLANLKPGSRTFFSDGYITRNSVADPGNFEEGGGCNQVIDVIRDDFSNIFYYHLFTFILFIEWYDLWQQKTT